MACQLVSLLREGRFEISISVPLVLEYEDVLLRVTELSDEAVLSVVRYLSSVAHRQKIFFLWRPSLPDPKDDVVLELAVASRALRAQEKCPLLDPPPLRGRGRHRPALRGRGEQAPALRFTGSSPGSRGRGVK